jgi:hypothetical protein
MPRSRRCTELTRDYDDGTASLEFITAGLVLLLPIVYLVLTMSAIQGGALAVEGAARQAARVYVDARSTDQADADASAAIDVALADYGIDARTAKVTVTCRPDPDSCLTRRGFVTVSVTTGVALPLIPPVLSVHQPLAVPLSSTATEQVSRFSEADQ